MLAPCCEAGQDHVQLQADRMHTVLRILLAPALQLVAQERPEGGEESIAKWVRGSLSLPPHLLFGEV